MVMTATVASIAEAMVRRSGDPLDRPLDLERDGFVPTEEEFKAMSDAAYSLWWGERTTQAVALTEADRRRLREVVLQEQLKTATLDSKDFYWEE